MKGGETIHSKTHLEGLSSNAPQRNEMTTIHSKA